QEPLGDGGPEQVAHWRLTCCEGPLYSFEGPRLWQRLPERHSGIDELLHIAIDEHHVAASPPGKRGLGLTLELGEVALAQRRRGGQSLQSLDLADDLTVDIRRQSTGFNRQAFPNVAELRLANTISPVCAEQQE